VADSQQGGGKQPASPMSMLGAGMDLAVAVLLFVLLGYKLDDWLGTKPWLVLVGALLGMLVGFYSLYKRVQRIQQGG
jgi:F0F1-type ATP synthase assembly protein I